MFLSSLLEVAEVREVVLGLEIKELIVKYDIENFEDGVGEGISCVLCELCVQVLAVGLESWLVGHVAATAALRELPK